MKRPSAYAAVIAAACAALLLATRSEPSAVASSGPEATLEPLSRVSDWIDGRATATQLTGKVVVLDVFTVDCYNCQNVVPTLRTLYVRDRDRGLAIVGIHSPETSAERERAYVMRSLAQQGIVWPVAVDNAFALWNAYGVSAWPTQLFFDRHGRLRRTIVGDSQDDAVRATVENLLAEK